MFFIVLVFLPTYTAKFILWPLLGGFISTG
jgi:hypothetical protein